MDNSGIDPAMKSKGFWQAVINYFRDETGSTRGYDSIVTNGEIRFALELVDVLKSVCRIRIGVRACLYVGFALEHFEGASQGGLDLNDKAVESVEETQEERPIGHDRAKKKSFASSRDGSSFVDFGSRQILQH
ncbi:hypothetical protein Tco_0710132 [Tanacetum coccineum]